MKNNTIRMIAILLTLCIVGAAGFYFGNARGITQGATQGTQEAQEARQQLSDLQELNRQSIAKLQATEGLPDANIVGIIDHHGIGSVKRGSDPLKQRSQLRCNTNVTLPFWKRSAFRTFRSSIWPIPNLARVRSLNRVIHFC